MSPALVIAVPSKGRLQENAQAFFARAGLDLVQPRGAREYRGTLAGLDGVEVAYLSAAEITAQLAQGAVHLGVSGEDLVRGNYISYDAVTELFQVNGGGSPTAGGFAKPGTGSCTSQPQSSPAFLATF